MSWRLQACILHFNTEFHVNCGYDTVFQLVMLYFVSWLQITCHVCYIRQVESPLNVR